MKDKRVLVTGGAGFIGSALAAKLCTLDYEVVIVDNLLTGVLNNIPNIEGCSFIKCDVNILEEIQPIITSYAFDYIFHFAAMVGVKRTLENPVGVLKDIDGFKNILSLAKGTGVKKVFFSSSSEVYGEPVELPQHEHTTPLNSRLPYAVVKNVGESFCRSFYQEYGLKYTIFRFFNTYGMNQSKDFVMSKFIDAALKGEDITIYGTGGQTRTFCYIDDTIDTCVASLRENEYVNDVLNVGNDRLINILELARIIINITGSSSRIVHLPPLSEGDMTRRQPSISKMKKLLARDLIPIENGVKCLID